MNTDSLIGAVYGSMMELDRNEKKLVPVVDLSVEEMYELCDLNAATDLTHENSQAYEANDDGKDNRNLIDDHGSSQRLTMEQIESLKTQASSDKEIIHNLCINSATFADKSVFSQEKYIRKKKQKYTNYFMIHKPNVRLLCDMYFQHKAIKSTTLRLDTLSQLLNACNVRSGGHYIVVDNYTGILAAAVIERLVGDGIGFPESLDPGTCIQMYLEQGPSASWRTCVDALNLPSSLLSRILLSYQMNQSRELLQVSDTNGVTVIPETIDVSQEEQGDSIDDKSLDACEASSEVKKKKRKLDDKFAEKNRRKADRRIEESKARGILLCKKVNAFILMTRDVDPCTPALLLMQFLQPSACFAIYSHVVEPLARCQLLLKPEAVNLRLSETWLRWYQILPGRTRPEMNMNGSGGYILTGTKIN